MSQDKLMNVFKLLDYDPARTSLAHYQVPNQAGRSLKQTVVAVEVQVSLYDTQRGLLNSFWRRRIDIMRPMVRRRRGEGVRGGRIVSKV